MNIFLEKDGTFSWRKALTAIAALCFLMAVIGHQFFGRPELPAQYVAMIAGVFAFYFFKDKMRNGTHPSG